MSFIVAEVKELKAEKRLVKYISFFSSYIGKYLTQRMQTKEIY